MPDSLEFLWDHRDEFWSGFRVTAELAFLGFAGALVLGTILAIMRISPAPPARVAGLMYVEWFRNVPLLVLMFTALFCLPKLGIAGFTQWRAALLVLATYTAAQVCEALRSGVNAVSKGQAEAARSIGMTFGQSLRYIVLPQAGRTVIPPLGSIFIALVKNTAVASAIGVTELTYHTKELGLSNPRHVLVILLGSAAAYLVITIPAGYAVSRFERRVAYVR